MLGRKGRRVKHPESSRAAPTMKASQRRGQMNSVFWIVAIVLVNSLRL